MSTIEIFATVIGIQMPSEHFGLIAPCSGLALKSIHVLEGIVDSDYQEEIKIILQNLRTVDLLIQKGGHIAQLLILPNFHGDTSLNEAPTVVATRGGKGFGSTDPLTLGTKIWMTHPNSLHPSTLYLQISLHKAMIQF